MRRIRTYGVHIARLEGEPSFYIDSSLVSYLITIKGGDDCLLMPIVDSTGTFYTVITGHNAKKGKDFVLCTGKDCRHCKGETAYTTTTAHKVIMKVAIEQGDVKKYGLLDVDYADWVPHLIHMSTASKAYICEFENGYRLDRPTNLTPTDAQDFDEDEINKIKLLNLP